VKMHMCKLWTWVLFHRRMQTLTSAYVQYAGSLAGSYIYTVKGWFTTCVPQFLEYAAGIHLPDAGSNVRMSPAGGRPFSSPYPYQYHNKACEVLYRTCVAHCPRVRMHNLCTGPNSKTFYNHSPDFDSILYDH